MPVKDIVDRVKEYETELELLETQLDPFDEIVDNNKVVSALNKLNTTKEELAALKVQLKHAIDNVDHNHAAALAYNVIDDQKKTDDGHDAAIAAGYEENEHLTKKTPNDDDGIEDKDEMYQPPNEPVGKTPFDDALYKSDSLYSDNSENELNDTPGDQDAGPEEVLIRSAEDQIMSVLINYVKNQNLDPSKLKQPIEASYYELRDELMDRANDDATQIQLHIDNILADVPKTISNRLQNDVNDVDEPSEISIDDQLNIDNEINDNDSNVQDAAENLPPGMVKLIDEMIEKHIWGRCGGKISDHDEVREDVIERMRNHNDLDDWENKVELYVRIINKNYEPKKVLIDNGFKLTEKYWKDSKGMFADTKKILVKALANYEKHKAIAEAAKGFDRIVQFHYLERHLNNVESKAEQVQNGLNPDHHKESAAVLDGVPYAVAQEIPKVQKAAEEAGKAFLGLTYEGVVSDPQMRPLWQAFLRDKKNIAHADQEAFRKRFVDLKERSTKLRDFAVQKLNLHFSYYDDLNDNINDEAAWNRVNSAVLGQLAVAFPVPFYAFVVEHAKKRAKEL